MANESSWKWLMNQHINNMWKWLMNQRINNMWKWLMNQRINNTVYVEILMVVNIDSLLLTEY